MRLRGEINKFRNDCLTDFSQFVKLMFLNTYRQKFIFGQHHYKICAALQKVITGDCKRLIINIAPRYGKTELVSKMFIAYGFAFNPESKFIHLSYSRDLARSNALGVRDIMLNEWYRLLFPYVRIVGRGGSNWATSKGGKMYSVSSGGQVTGFGAGKVDEEEQLTDEAFSETKNRFAGAIVIDDPLKPDDALSDKTREFVNYRFESTIRSRANSRNTPIVIIMQRLHENDLCGFLMQNEPDTWEILSLPCIRTDAEGKEQPLWEHKHTLEELHKLQRLNPYVFDTQYMQNPTPLRGLMYERFRTYETLPIEQGVVKAYVDTADTGKDFLCAIVYKETPTAFYVLDVFYTQKGMEYTEPETARMLVANKVERVAIESNNGGRGFARNVERYVRMLENKKMIFSTFAQTMNKETRIFSHSAEVMNCVYFPSDWDRRFPLFAQTMKSYRKEGRNAHDDAPDAVTGIIEQRDSRQTTRFSRT